MIADALDKVGSNGVLSIEGSNSTETFVEVTEGMEIDRGYISPQFVNIQARTRTARFRGRFMHPLLSRRMSACPGRAACGSLRCRQPPPASSDPLNWHIHFPKPRQTRPKPHHKTPKPTNPANRSACWSSTTTAACW
jgi:hypothetical protein